MSSLSSLDPYSDYVGVNISLNNSSSLSFLNVYAPPIRFSPTDGKIDSFSPSIFSSSRNLFILGGFICHPSFWDSKSTSDPRGRNYSIGLSLLTSSPSMTLIYLPFFIAPLLTSPPLLPSCSWEVLQDLGSNHLPILLTILLSPQQASLIL